jgi:hypothetical protein
VVDEDGNAATEVVRTLTVREPILATAVINSVTGIGETIATVNAAVTDVGDAGVTERGICYVAGTGTPTTANTKIVDTGGTGTGSFALEMTGLTAESIYSIRAYAINGYGTSYSAIEEVETLPQVLPLVETLVVVDYGYGTPSCNVLFRFNIVSAGNLAIGDTSWGISWGTTASADSFEDIGADYTTLGEKTRYVTSDVPPNTLIYYKAKATNIDGSYYGEVLSFTTPSS